MANLQRNRAACKRKVSAVGVAAFWLLTMSLPQVSQNQLSARALALSVPQQHRSIFSFEPILQELADFMTMIIIARNFGRIQLRMAAQLAAIRGVLEFSK
jgi:hypothetical protein